jgi:pimeloyl-ACP methyl ester carboxylesterase
MNELAFTRCGSGAPLVLLHGLGSARDAWLPVTGSLARHFDVIALDLPGFGGSAPLPAFEEPHPARLAQSVAATLRALDIEHPHIVGNSLGGWVALELAAIIAPASVTLLSPAGLWRQGTPGYCRVSLRASRFLARFLGGLLRAAVRTRLGGAPDPGPGAAGHHRARPLSRLPVHLPGHPAPPVPGHGADHRPGHGHVRCA